MNNQEKQQKLQQKLVKIKDQYITDVINITQRLVDDIQEIKAESQELNESQKETKKDK